MNHYILEPQNERQSMNCRVEVKCSHKAVVAAAARIAEVMQSVLPGNDVTCAVRRAGKDKATFAVSPEWVVFRV
jgi:hypothetical protein